MRYHKATGEEVIVYTAEEKERALLVNLVSLASSLGYTPVRQGSHYSLKEMDSLIIYNERSWKRWSEKGNRNGGSQIDFLLEFGNVDTVPEAVQYLLEFNGERIRDVYAAEQQAESKSRELQLPEKNVNYKRLYAYLMKTRGLSQEVVSYFVKNKLIYEDAVHHNIVYCGYDPDGNIKYAGLRGTADAYGRKFKGDVPGNDKNYGVNIVNKDSGELKVFESVIDCMSYMDMYGDYTSNKLILGMVEDNPLQQFIKDYSHIKKIIFCLDNDEAGQKAIYIGKTLQSGEYKPGLKEKYEKLGYVIGVEKPSVGKDFNECLLAKKCNSAPVVDDIPPEPSNKKYVTEFYNQMMAIVGYHQETVDESESLATVKYVSGNGQKYLSDGYDDYYSWIKENPDFTAEQKGMAAKLNQQIRNICLIKNSLGEIGFYIEGVPKERYRLSDQNGLLYTKETRHKLYYNFESILTYREIDKLYSICEHLEKQMQRETASASVNNEQRYTNKKEKSSQPTQNPPMRRRTGR